MRVLLTGAGGFIGRHCLSALRARGCEVCAVSSRPRTADGVEWRQVDLLDPAQVRDLMASVRPTHLLHLAWVTTPGEYWTSPDNLDWVQATVHLLRQFQLCGGKRAVMAGSCAEYDWTQGTCIENVTPLAPTTLYGASKHAVQLLADAFARQTHLSLAWGRVFFVYGPHEHPARLVPDVIRALLAGRSAQCSAGTQSRDFLFVEDLAAAFVALLFSQVTGPVNLGSGAPVTIRTLVLQLAEMLDAAHLVQFGTRPAAVGEPDVLVADVGRLTTEAGWQPRYTMAEGLAATVQWHREQASSR